MDIPSVSLFINPFSTHSFVYFFKLNKQLSGFHTAFI